MERTERKYMERFKNKHRTEAREASKTEAQFLRDLQRIEGRKPIIYHVCEPMPWDDRAYDGYEQANEYSNLFAY